MDLWRAVHAPQDTKVKRQKGLSYAVCTVAIQQPRDHLGVSWSCYTVNTTLCAKSGGRVLAPTRRIHVLHNTIT